MTQKPAFLVTLDEQEGLTLLVPIESAMFENMSLYEMYRLMRDLYPGYRVDFPEVS